jgi:hypothetical protein
LAITQILDERQSDDGKLILEIKATSRGLVPDFQQLFGKADFGDFEVTDEIADDGVVVNQFDPSAETNIVTSERSWVVTLQPKDGLAEKPNQFSFLQPKLETKEVAWQRYDDADLKSAGQFVSLERQYSSSATSKLWAFVLVGAGGLAAVIALIIVVLLLRKGPAKNTVALPENMSPFVLIRLLRQVETGNGLTEKRRTELGDSIRKLESWYFAQSGNNGAEHHPDLNRIAKTWLTPVAMNAIHARSNGNGSVSIGLPTA